MICLDNIMVGQVETEPMSGMVIVNQLLIVSAAMVPLHFLANVCYFTLRSGGDTAITFMFDSGLLWVSSIPFAFILSRFTALSVVSMYFTVECLTLIKIIFGFFLAKKPEMGQ